MYSYTWGPWDCQAKAESPGNLPEEIHNGSRRQANKQCSPLNHLTGTRSGSIIQWTLTHQSWRLYTGLEGIWKKEASYNLRKDHSNIPEQEPVIITVANVKKKVLKMRRWAAPGPDMIHTSWLKMLTDFYECLAAQMNQLLSDGTHPGWLTERWTILIPKDPQNQMQRAQRGISRDTATN